MIIANGYEYHKDGLIYFTSQEEIPCPGCAGKLYVHGTCKRKLRTGNDGVKLYRLRVMECRVCGKTHRELPGNIIPYKRMDLESVSGLAQISHVDNLNNLEASTWRRVRTWMLRFLAYAIELLNCPCEEDRDFPSLTPECAHEYLAYGIKRVVNMGQWIQHCLALHTS